MIRVRQMAIMRMERYVVVMPQSYPTLAPIARILPTPMKKFLPLPPMPGRRCPIPPYRTPPACISPIWDLAGGAIQVLGIVASGHRVGDGRRVSAGSSRSASSGLPALDLSGSAGGGESERQEGGEDNLLGHASTMRQRPHLVKEDRPSESQCPQVHSLDDRPQSSDPAHPTLSGRRLMRVPDRRSSRIRRIAPPKRGRVGFFRPRRRRCGRGGR